MNNIKINQRSVEMNGERFGLKGDYVSGDSSKDVEIKRYSKTVTGADGRIYQIMHTITVMDVTEAFNTNTEPKTINS